VVGSLELPGEKSFRVLAADNRLFLFAHGGRTLVALDIADPKRPVVTAELTTEELNIGGETVTFEVKDTGGNGVPGTAYANGHLYLATGGKAPDAPYVLIFDVREPDKILPAGALRVRDRKGWQYFACDVITEGDRLYLGDYGCEEVYDLTNPLRPERISQYRRAYAWQAGTVRGDYWYLPKLDGLEILACPE